jgi:hypothetical protein
LLNWLGTVRALLLPASDGLVGRGGLAREPQARGAVLAAGRAESTRQTTKARSIVAVRRILHPTSARASEPCLDL